MRERIVQRLQLQQTIHNIVNEIGHARRLCADLPSLLRWSSDIVLFRLLRVIDCPGHDRPRTITLKGDLQLTYRLNRGDVLTLREVWIDEVYRIPQTASCAPRSLVDLGANIGLASVWFAAVYGCDQIVAVEPLPENVELLRHNLAQNHIRATVLVCAVGQANGVGYFAPAGEPNSGHLAPQGEPVDLASMDAVLHELVPGGKADILKIDIEGAEQTLFTGELQWLAGVQVILIELHPRLIDVPHVIGAIERSGFEIAQPLNELEGAVTCFTARRESLRG